MSDVRGRKADAVLVTGATGFIGRRLVRALVERGEHVIAMVRGSRIPWASGRIDEVIGDVTELRAVIRAAQGATRIVHLAGMISLRGTSYDAAFRTNVVGTRNVLDAARLAGASRVVVLGTQSENPGAYATTKRQADELVLSSDVPHVVLRPSLVYGPDAGGVFAAVARLVRKLPVVPLVGTGEHPLAPVFVDDVCAAVCEAVARKDVGPQYHLSGPRVVTFRRFVELVAEAQGSRRVFVPVPYRLVAMGIGAAERLRVPLPLTSDTLQGLVHPRIHPNDDAARDLGFRPIDLEEGLRRTFH